MKKDRRIAWLVMAILLIAMLALFFLYLAPGKEERSISDAEYASIFFVKRKYPELDGMIKEAMRDKKITRTEYVRIMDASRRLDERR